MRKRAALAAFAAVTALLAAACGSTGTPVDPAPVSAADPPRPPNVQENPPPPSGSAAATTNCSPPATASFRPGALPSAGQMPGGTVMQEIAGRKLIAGVDQNTFLFGFRNPSTNTLEGFDIDRVREVALAIFGGDPTKIDDHIQYRVVTSAGRIPALQNGDVDIVVRTMTANCDRWKQIYFSEIYYTAGQQVLVEKTSPLTGVADLGGKKVCAQRGSTSVPNLAAKQPKAIPVVTDTWSDCLVLLQQHEVDAVSTDNTILNGMQAQDPNTKLVGDPFTREPYGIGISQKHEDLVRFVNGVLEKSFKNGDWQKSYDTWVGRTGQTAPVPTPQYRD